MFSCHALGLFPNKKNAAFYERLWNNSSFDETARKSEDWVWVTQISQADGFNVVYLSYTVVAILQ